MSPAAEEREPSTGERLLSLLGDPERRVIDCRHVTAVFAHPDDETIAMGGTLSRLAGIRLAHVTDGAPADMADARANGFSRREDYAAARRRELAAALGRAGIGCDALLFLGAADQAAAFRMPELAKRLLAIFGTSGAGLVITHAYEGGHPDHDATAFVVHAASRLAACSSGTALEIIECPLYHARKGEWVRQEFPLADLPHCGGDIRQGRGGPGRFRHAGADTNREAASPPSVTFGDVSPSGGEMEVRGSSEKIMPPETVIELDAEAVRAKREMLAAHRTQRRTLELFGTGPERFRLAPRYDFSQRPNGGELLYERFDWGLDGETWLRLAQEARSALGLPRWF